MAHIIINPSLSAAIAYNLFLIYQNLRKLAQFKNRQTQREQTIAGPDHTKYLRDVGTYTIHPNSPGGHKIICTSTPRNSIPKQLVFLLDATLRPKHYGFWPPYPIMWYDNFTADQ